MVERTCVTLSYRPGITLAVGKAYFQTTHLRHRNTLCSRRPRNQVMDYKHRIRPVDRALITSPSFSPESPLVYHQLRSHDSTKFLTRPQWWISYIEMQKSASNEIVNSKIWISRYGILAANHKISIMYPACMRSKIWVDCGEWHYATTYIVLQSMHVV